MVGGYGVYVLLVIRRCLKIERELRVCWRWDGMVVIWCVWESVVYDWGVGGMDPVWDYG